MNGLIFAVVIIAVYYVVKFLRSYIKWWTSPLWSLPGPRGSYLVGQFAMIRKEPFMDPAKRWWKKAGVNTPLIHYCMPLGIQTLLVLDADIVRDILYANYGERPRFMKKLNGIIPLVGNGLVTLEGKDWQRHRRIIHPSFQPGLIRESLGDFIPKTMAKFINYWEKADGREIDVGTHISNLTLDIIGEVAFSHDFHALDSIERWANKGVESYDKLDPVDDKVMKSMAMMIRNSGRRILMQILNLSALDFATAKTSKLLDEAVEEVITEARRKLEKNKNLENNNNSISDDDTGAVTTKTLDGDHSRISLLQRLLVAENSDTKKSARKSLEVHELRDEVKTFLIAGHETTSTWCYWAFFILCEYPDIQEKVLQDINKHSARENNSDDISMEMIEKMTYFNAFMKEVLRMYPPIGIIIRYNVKDEKLEGATVPANTRLIIPIHLLHRHPNYWKDPDSFKPERWLGKEHPSSHKHAYMPFSNGPRNCIGYHFAEMEAKLLMAPLIRHFSFRMAPSLRDTDFTFTTFIAMKSKPDLKIVIRARK